VDLIPYARVLGVQCECYGEEIIFRLPANADNIGNPTIPAIHGGVIASFMELTALFQLTLQLPQPGLAKIIDFSGLHARRVGSGYLRHLRCQPSGASRWQLLGTGLAGAQEQADCAGARAFPSGCRCGVPNYVLSA